LPPEKTYEIREASVATQTTVETFLTVVTAGLTTMKIC
jgi:hypothetical protein